MMIAANIRSLLVISEMGVIRIIEYRERTHKSGRLGIFFFFFLNVTLANTHSLTPHFAVIREEKNNINNVSLPYSGDFYRQKTRVSILSQPPAVRWQQR